MSAIFGILTTISLYIMVGVVIAGWAKAHNEPVWFRLFALVAWPVVLIIGSVVLFINAVKDILKD